MVKKKEVEPKERKPIDEIVYRCNTCGKVNETKDCCGNDFTEQFRRIQE